MAIVSTGTTGFGSQRYSSGLNSLYVGDLSPDVTEEDLIKKFSLTVPVVSAHLCRNSATGKSLCYSYINLESPSTASNAMACLNHTDLKGKPMRIMWCQKEISKLRQSGIGNLFVKNLNSSITSICLERIFSPFGCILSCKVAEQNGQSKGFGFVQFDSEQAAVAARCSLHGSMVQGKRLFVSKFIKKTERTSMSEKQDFTNVYVKNLVENVTEDILYKKFSQFGTVSSVVIMRDGLKRSRGFGFVNFCRPEHARKAIDSLNGSSLGSKILFVGRALKKAERREMLKQELKEKYISKFKEGWVNLYVKNLSESIDETRLREIFGCYGEIVSAIVMRHGNGKSKGFGFVCFSNGEDSKQAKKKLNGIALDGKSLVVRVAERKEERLKRLQQFFHGQQSHYYPSPAHPVPSPAQPIQQMVPNGYLQAIYNGMPYYYMCQQLAPMFNQQNITTTYAPSKQGKLKENISVQLVYKQPPTYVKSAAKQKLVYKDEDNRKAAPISEEPTSVDESLEEASLVLRALLAKEKSGRSK